MPDILCSADISYLVSSGVISLGFNKCGCSEFPLYSSVAVCQHLAVVAQKSEVRPLPAVMSVHARVRHKAVVLQTVLAVTSILSFSGFM